jgi:hypothetical protein
MISCRINGSEVFNEDIDTTGKACVDIDMDALQSPDKSKVPIVGDTITLQELCLLECPTLNFAIAQAVIAQNPIGVDLEPTDPIRTVPIV